MKRILRLASSPPVGLGSLIFIVTLIGTLNGRHFIGIAVMPDELGYMKQAVHLADTFGFSMPGDLWYNSPAQIVPLFYAPFYALLPTTAAVMGIHALNSAAIAFAAIPVYLVVYEVTKIHRAALFSAALTTITPWLVMSSSLMTEPISYAAFCWTFWGVFRAIQEPNKWRLTLACLLVVGAIFTRSQLIIFLIAPFLTIAMILAASIKRNTYGFPLKKLAFTCFLGATAGVYLFVSKNSHFLIGTNYQSIQNSHFDWKSIFTTSNETLAYVILGSGIIAFPFAIAWIFGQFIRPTSEMPFC